MRVLPRRSILALAAVIDIALYCRPLPVSAKALAERLNLPPRHLEPILQALVHADILKGFRGPKGGYELAKERRKITASDILEAVIEGDGTAEEISAASQFVECVVLPMMDAASKAFLSELGKITIEDICHRAESRRIYGEYKQSPDFMI